MSTKFQSNIYTLRFDIIIKVCLYLKLCFGSLHNRRRLTLVRERTNNQRYAQPCRGEIIEDRCSCSIFETQLSSTRVLDLQSLSKCEDYMHISSWVYEIWVDFLGDLRIVNTPRQNIGMYVYVLICMTLMQVDANGVPVPYKQTQKYKKSHARYMRYWRSVHESPHLRDWYGQRISSQPQPMVADISV